jgi:hypothetical protein
MSILILRSSGPPPDTTPNQFTFTDQTSVSLSSTITSTAVTIAGLGTGVSQTFSASGGTIDKNNDGNFQASQSLANGDTMRARVTSSASNSTPTNCVVSCNGVSDTFTATTVSSGGGANIFVADWTDPDATDSNCYNFGVGARRTPGSNWVHTHLPTGGPTGGPCPRITQLAGQEQYQIGWVTPTNSETWTLGDSKFFRIALYPESGVWTPNSREGKTKLLIHGSQAPTQGRTILYMNPPDADNGGLGNRNYGGVEGDVAAGQVCSWARPSYFGLSGATDWSDMGTDYFSAHPLLNVEGWPYCGRAVCLVNATDPTPPAPSPNGPSAAPTDGWYWLQFEFKSGASGEMRTWVNNNVQASPSAERTGITGFTGSGIAISGWTGQVELGAYSDDAPLSDLSYRIGAFEWGREFRDDWGPY